MTNQEFIEQVAKFVQKYTSVASLLRSSPVVLLP